MTADRLGLVVDLLKDKRAFYIEASTLLANDLRRKSPRGPLRGIRVSTDRARGIVTGYTFSSLNGGPLTGQPRDEPVYFSASRSGWLIDFPAQQELDAFYIEQSGSELTGRLPDGTESR